MRGSGIFILSCFAAIWLVFAKLNAAPLPWPVVAIGICLSTVLVWWNRQQDDGPSNLSAAEQKRIGRVYLWSSIGEGIGIFVVINVLASVHLSDRVMAGIALVVGLHFIPIGLKVPMKVALVLAATLLAISVVGFAVPSAEYAALFVGCAGAVTLWSVVVASTLRSRRRVQSK